jgi:alkylation response protein AidB-like acyl-CoA dehydrogenase
MGQCGAAESGRVPRMMRDARMFTIGGGTAQILRSVVASRLLGPRLPQTRDGYLNAMSQE